jgi:hypothetical protein
MNGVLEKSNATTNVETLPKKGVVYRWIALSDITLGILMNSIHTRILLISQQQLIEVIK